MSGDPTQRLTALAGALLHPEAPGGDERDPYAVCFLPESGEFMSFAAADRDRSVPLNVLFDATELGDWLLDSPLRDERELRKRILEAGRRIREYSFPLYVVEQDDDETLRAPGRSDRPAIDELLRGTGSEG